MADDLLDDVRERVLSLRKNDFEPFKVVLPPSVFSDVYDHGLDEEIDLELGSCSILEDLDKDFVVCFRDNLDDSPLAMPSPEIVRDEIVDNLEFTDLDPEVAKEHGYDHVEEGDKGLMVELFADVETKGVEFNEENLESLSFSKEDLPVDEEVEEADDSFQQPIEFAVVSSDLDDLEDKSSEYGSIDSEEELVKEAMKDRLTDEIVRTLYKGEFAYPFHYQESEDREPVRIGREFFRFDKVMMPEVSES